MSGVGEAGLVLGIISGIISIIDATKQVYDAVEDEAGLPTNFKKSATKLPLISKLLDDADKYVNSVDESTKATFVPTLESCKDRATQLQELFEKVIPKDGDSRWDRYSKAALSIGKGGRVESLLGGILKDLQLLATRFPEVTTLRGKDDLAKAIEEVAKMEPSLPEGFEQAPAYAHYGSGAQNINMGSGPQHNYSNQNSGLTNQYIGTNNIGAVTNKSEISHDNSTSQVQFIGTEATLESDTHGNKHWIVPRPVNNLFTGRTELLDRMKKALSVIDTSLTDKQKADINISPDKQKIFVITGLGGQGKSEICLKVASLMRELFWGVFWVDVNTPSTAESGFITVAKKLDCLVENVADALRVLANAKQTWLLILDNADDPGFDYQVYLLPSGTHGAIIITSRVYECRNYNTVGAEAMKGLESQDSQEILFKAAKLPQESWSTYTSEAKEVLRLLGSHTLALIQAGAYIARGHCKLHEYPKVFQHYRKRLMEFSPRQARSTYGNVYATFDTSADVLKQSKSEAASDALQLLEILSMLDSSVLPLQIFQSTSEGCRFVRRNRMKENNTCDVTTSHVLQLPHFIIADSNEWDPYRLTEARSLLASLSLVTQHDLDGSPGLSMHPLTHAWAKDRQDSKKQGMAWISTGCVLAISQFNDYIWRTQERRLLPHIQSFLNIRINKAFSFESKAIVIPILLQCGQALLYMRQDYKLSCLLEDIFVELRQKPEQPLIEFLPLYGLQAKSLISLDKYQKAVELLEQIVEIREAILAEDHPDYLLSQHALSCAYLANGQVKEAIKMLEQVVKIQGATLAKDHLDQLASQHVLSSAYMANRQVKEAIKMLEQVVKTQGATLMEDHPDHLRSQHALSCAYWANGQTNEAVELLEHFVRIVRLKWPKDHPYRIAYEKTLASYLRKVDL
ncbi:hypothetical protein V500_06177 [Pseudogymnoascus sp. VKM F-4518 (FW-2643)]|nr:hypothetical protein V500_06177 [Pseudogymnoascus sp. VKM F-4518 (FW-2643)]